MFADESVAAVSFTFTKLLVLPLAMFLAYLSVLVLMYIITTIRIRAFEKPDTSDYFGNGKFRRRHFTHGNLQGEPNGHRRTPLFLQR